MKPPAGLQLDTPAPAAPALPGETVLVERFRFSGSTIVPESELQAIVAPWTGKRLSPDELRAALTAVTAHLRERGLFAAQAVLPSQDVSAGEIRIDIIEGRIGKVDVEQPAGSRLRPSVARGYLSSLQSGTLIARGHLDTPLLLLNDLPGVRVEPSLTPGSLPGTADLDVKVSDERLFGGFVRVDNHQIREFGEIRYTAQARLRNPLGIGDLATVEGYRSNTGDELGAGASYSAPINYHGTRLGAQFGRYRYRLGGDFEALRLNGDFRRYSVFAAHPVLRTNNSNLTAYAAYTDVEYNDRIDAVALAGTTRHRFLTARLAGDLADGLFRGGVTAFYLEYQGGDVRGNTPIESPALGTSGGFDRGRIHFERLQQVTSGSAAFASFTAQVASKNLAAGREILLSGPQGVRAYPVEELPADQGYLVKLEYRHRLLAGDRWRTTATGFVDYAHGRFNKEPVVGTALNTRDIWGYGVALAAAHDAGFSAQLMFAWRGSAAPLTDPGRSPRIWFAATQQF